MLILNLDITGNWHDNQIPLCKWIDTGSHNIKIELKSDTGNIFANIVLMMACVEKQIHGVDFTFRFEWRLRQNLKFSTCRSISTGG